MTAQPTDGRFWLRRWLALLTSPLYINSLYLLGGTAASGVLGFVFWIVAARWSSAADVGLATATIASVALLIALCDLGLTVAMVRTITGQHPRLLTLVHAMSAGGWVVSGLAALVFIVGIPLFAPRLDVLRHDLVTWGLFCVFVMMNYVLMLQDAIAMALRRASYVFWRNLACNLPSVMLLPLVLPIVSDFRGLLAAYCLPNLLVALYTGLRIMPRYLPGYRLFGVPNLAAFRELLPYGLKNYVSNLLWGVAGFLLPVLAINVATAAATAPFFVIWTMFSFLLIIPRSVSATMFVEGNIQRGDIGVISLRAFALIIGITLPGALLLWFAGDFVLHLFGRSYVDMTLLRILLASLPAFAVNSICFVMLRLKERGGQLIGYCFLVSAAILCSATLLVPGYGLHGLALGWLI
ncbi:MAG: oligosaccharide flippase family protein, partial [Chloroflexaceae bacterium]|nr:oligosaccharide flippase family protein [Chloroflexaceae bacterium]